MSNTGINGATIASLFNNRNLINLLGEAAAGLDPQGIGGVLGKSAVTLNKAVAAQQAKEQSDARAAEQTQILRDFVRSQGGMTPSGQRGITKLKANNDGSYSVDLNLSDTANTPLIPVTPPPAATSETTTTIAPQQAAPTPAQAVPQQMPATTAPPETVAPPPAVTPQTTPVQQTPTIGQDLRQSRSDLARMIIPFYLAPEAYRRVV